MKKIMMIAGGSALLLGAILFGAFFAGPMFASAQTTSGNTTSATTATGTNQYCEQYLQDLAGRLKVSVSTLQQDKLSAREDVLAQMVKDGKLTQNQANAIIQKLENHQACSATGKAWGLRIVVSSLKQYVPQMESQVASGLHLSVAQLQSDLKSGMSLEKIAKQQNVSTTQLQSTVQSAIQSAVNQAVSDKNLTQQQATDFTQFLQQHPGVLHRILNREFKNA